MKFGQKVCFDHFLVRFFMCYDTQVSVTGASWPTCWQCYRPATHPYFTFRTITWVKFSGFDVSIDIMEICFGIAHRKISSIFVSVICPRRNNCGVFSFHVLLKFMFSKPSETLLNTEIFQIQIQMVCSFFFFFFCKFLYLWKIIARSSLRRDRKSWFPKETFWDSFSSTTW